MSDRLNEIARLADALAITNGRRTCGSWGVSLFRDEKATIGRPIFLRPGILIGIRGRLELSCDVNVHIVDVGRFFLLSAGLPLRVSTAATRAAPLIFLHVGFDHALAVAIAAQRAAGPVASKAEGMCQTSGYVGEEIQNVVHRVLRSFNDVVACRFLMSGLVRELHFWLMDMITDFPLLLRPDDRTTRGKVLGTLDSLSKPTRCALPIEALAAVNQMSLSSYHSHFKALFGCTPLEYQKAVRLHAARALLNTDNRSIAEIGRAVGYGGPSQFSREYHRYFGCTARDHSNIEQEAICELERL